MMTHRERIIGAMKGEMVDVIPFVPRLDLWWLANSARGTLPEEFKGMMPDEISRKHGWPVYHMVPNFADVSGRDDVLHRSIGLFNFKQSVYGWRFSDDIEVRVKDNEGQQIVEYHTPLGMARTVGGLTEEMKKAGASLGWVQEHLIKNPDDYKIASFIFENIEVFPQYGGAQEYIDMVGDDGVAAAGGPSLGASPMHLIQKELMDSTLFFYEYRDNYSEMSSLAASIEKYYERVLEIIEESPAQVILWGANYDDMLTYPPYFKKEIVPWLRRASEQLGARGKIMATHTDGENFGLMDLIRDCGAHVAESVTPYPMTKVTIEEYYRQWRGNITVMGGIPESILLEETASEDDFEAFLDNLFGSVSPGDRIILGTADSTPPNAVFGRLLRIHERVQEEGRLPLAAGAADPVSEKRREKATASVTGTADLDERFTGIREDLMKGDGPGLTERALEMIRSGTSADDILNRGMIPAMEIIGDQFSAGEVFIPEVLLCARAMNTAMLEIEPFFTKSGSSEKQRVLIGTVQGDMHDIGKNMVGIMLRGQGFEIRDLGVNVTADEFVRQVREYRPHILALSALLTTTMPEMKNIISLLEKEGLRDSVRVMIGGAPVNSKFAHDIGADAYADNAAEAVAAAKVIKCE